jgi:hypothetical protein
LDVRKTLKYRRNYQMFAAGEAGGRGANLPKAADLAERFTIH